MLSLHLLILSYLPTFNLWPPCLCSHPVVVNEHLTSTRCLVCDGAWCSLDAGSLEKQPSSQVPAMLRCKWQPPISRRQQSSICCRRYLSDRVWTSVNHGVITGVVQLEKKPCLYTGVNLYLTHCNHGYIIYSNK